MLVKLFPLFLQEKLDSSYVKFRALKLILTENWKLLCLFSSSFFTMVFILFVVVCWVCVWMWVCAPQEMCWGTPQEDIGYLGAGVTGSCELPDVGAGNWTQVPRKNSACSQRIRRLSGPILRGAFQHSSYRIGFLGPQIVLPIVTVASLSGLHSLAPYP